MVSDTDKCGKCKGPISYSSDRCPHCGADVGFPNVRDAGRDEERAELEGRYQRAMHDARARGVAGNVALFEAEMSRSTAVIHRDFPELDRLASSDLAIYATYYDLTETMRLPKGEKWDFLRAVVDEGVFPRYREKIRFAALTVTGRGLDSYGPCAMVLREESIAERASVFEENTILWARRLDLRLAGVHELPRGFRATWQDRPRLAVAKLAGQIENDTPPERFAEILIRPGADTESDDFIEVHVYGPITIRSVERISARPGSPDEQLKGEKIRIMAEQYGVGYEEV